MRAGPDGLANLFIEAADGRLLRLELAEGRAMLKSK